MDATGRRPGRPRKEVKFGDPVMPGMSRRAIAKALGVRRRFLAQADAIGSIPEAEFEALVESDDPPTVAALVNLARRRAGKSTDYERRCPHCRKVLRMEDSS